MSVSRWCRVKAFAETLCLGVEKTAQPAMCICRGELAQLSGVECYIRFCQRLHPELDINSGLFEEHAQALMRGAAQYPERQITCDLCSAGILPFEDQVAWRCSNGYQTIWHS